MKKNEENDAELAIAVGVPTIAICGMLEDISDEKTRGVVMKCVLETFYQSDKVLFLAAISSLMDEKMQEV